MLKRFFTLIAVLGLAAGTALAQDIKFSTNYAPGREKLAESVFKELSGLCTGSNALNLTSDFIDSMDAIKDHPELRTAILENYIFDYCNVEDALKTEENIKAQEFEGKSYYTLRFREEWGELGKKYTELRLALEKENAN